MLTPFVPDNEYKLIVPVLLLVSLSLNIPIPLPTFKHVVLSILVLNILKFTELFNIRPFN